jgi:hypothetical protein
MQQPAGHANAAPAQAPQMQPQQVPQPPQQAASAATSAGFTVTRIDPPGASAPSSEEMEQAEEDEIPEVIEDPFAGLAPMQT